ncbi:MAG: alpha/beta hydrolase [Chloroflexota bacterium]|nr:alpha/beta hydrolase [Chloroflexota bacterium]MDQ5866561.1 alpha/beta hydrolase [Chloroflexota bacterium]
MVLLTSLLFAHMGQANAAALLQADGITTQRNVTYCTAGGEALKLDLFLPRPGNGPAPVVVYIHGGSWVGGDKFEVGLAGNELAKKGYAVASINYRLGPKHKWPAQIQDAKCAVRYLRASARQYNLDPNRIAAWGSSAGGHLAAMLGLTDASAGFDNSGQHLDQSSRVQAVVDMFGPTDLNAYDPDKFLKGIGQAVFGVTRDEPGARELLRRASPVTYAANAAGVPFLILHGDKDSLVPLSQSQALYDRLIAGGSQAELVVVKNGEHGFRPTGGPIDPTTAQIRNRIDNFLDRTLGNTSAASQTFPQTGKTVQGVFLRYWSSNGGLAQFGYPISGEMQEASDTDGKTYTVQYFERAVFELHPENARPYDVLLTLLGSMRYAQKYPGAAPGQVPNAAPGSMLFPETGKRIGGMFLEYWKANGGLARQGYPISEEFKEVSPVDGKTYTVQYFERAVFEYHPENRPPYQVLLSPLGTFRYDARHGSGQP